MKKHEILIWCTNPDQLETPAHYTHSDFDMTSQGWVPVEKLYVTQTRELSQDERIAATAASLQAEKTRMVEKHKNEFEELQKRIEKFQALCYDVKGE